jgi:site-specific DNA-methyltransferase (adenine-specific)
MQIVPITQVVPNTSNPRIIKDDKFKKLVKSIKEFPEMLNLRPIVVDKDMVVLGGNMRLKACQAAGLTEVPIIVADQLTPEQQAEFIIKDNVGFGEWDWDILANEWDAELLQDWGLELPFDNTPVLEAEEDDYEAPSEIKTDIVLGDLIEIGQHRLLCGDSTDSDQVARLMNGEKADMVFTDPPYGYSYESNYQKKHKELLNDDKILDFLPNAYLFSNENVAFYIFCGWQTIKQWIQEVENCGVILKNIIIWKKNNWSMGDLKGAYAGQYEVILFAHKGRVNLKNGRGQDIWEFDRVPPKDHPTMKPVELIEKAVNDVTNFDNIILDLFLGSGSTMIAAHQLNRKCFGMELDPKYCQVILDRMHKLDPSLEIKINGKLYGQD